MRPALRRFIEQFPAHPRLAEARLELEPGRHRFIQEFHLLEAGEAIASLQTAGLVELERDDNGVATCEFSDGKMACFYASRTMAHGHETLTEIFGTAGRLTVGQNPRLNRVDIADAHGIRNECTPTFYERFEEAFLHETNHFVQAVLDDGTKMP